MQRVFWWELTNPATKESNTSYIGTSNSMRSQETWSWDLMRLGLIESHENSHLTRVILEKISISQKCIRQDWDPTLKISLVVGTKGAAGDDIDKKRETYCTFDFNRPLLNLGSISQAPLGQRPYFLILLPNSMSELCNRINNKFNCMGRSWDIISLNSGVGLRESCDNVYLRFFIFWWYHQWHVTLYLVNS